jgi:hypothetical protein
MGSAVGVAMICLLVWTGSAMALSYDGTVSVEYSGTRDQSFVYQPTNPAVWQGTLHLARTLRAYHVAIRMTAGQVQTAQSGLIIALRRHDVTAADVAGVKRLLRGRGLNILNTLGR